MTTKHDFNELLNKIYTAQQWEQDEVFGAIAGQEVDEEVYERMYECLPPYRLNLFRQNRDLNIGSGFLVGEPYIHGPASNGKYTAYYAAFGRVRGKEKQYFFLGYQNTLGDEYNPETEQFTMWNDREGIDKN
jgi:hypothetical protein